MTTMEELFAHPELIYRCTVDDYHEMIANGTVKEGEPFELLDGQIVRKIRSAVGEDIMTVGVEHALIVSRLAKLDRQFERCGCHVRTQQPVTVVPRDEPEPDAVIVRGTIEDYTTHHPLPSDILCIIEVAETSLARDRGYKRERYATAAIPVYVIINLIDRVVEVYENPDAQAGTYAPPRKLRHGDQLSLPTVAGEPVMVPVERLFLK